MLDAFKPVAARVAATLEKEPGHIKVVGHTDNTPMTPRVFLPISNSPWSGRKRSADLLKQGLADPNRVDIEGKGRTLRSHTNSTPEGRAKNRRVEIFIERSE